MSNARTLETYNAGVDQYIDNTPHDVSGPVKLWFDRLFEGADEDCRILEIGSAFGRDASYLESKGYQVHRTDGSAGFVNYLRGKGQDATELNVLTDEIPRASFDIAFADAVFLHFNQDEFVQAAKNVHSGLATGGKFGLTLKRGDGEETSTAKMDSYRFFKYWQPSVLSKVLAECGFDPISVESDEKWIYAIAQKGSAK